MRKSASSSKTGRQVLPSLKNLKFYHAKFLFVDKVILTLVVAILIASISQNNLSCTNINLKYDANQDGLITYQDIGHFANQLYFQPLLSLQKQNALDYFFGFLNIHKKICLSFESILFSLIVWLTISYLAIKSILIARYAIRIALHKLLFEVIKINRFSSINKKLYKFLYPVKIFRFNAIFITILCVGLAVAQVKLMFTSVSHAPKNQLNGAAKIVQNKKNRQPNLAESGKNYENLYLINAKSLKKLDSRIEGITDAETKNIYLLSKALTEGLDTDLEKIYTIYRWVTNNIEYDADAFFSNNLRGIGNANTVIQRRKAVCDGYAELIMRLGIQAGILVEKVDGYAKGYGYKIGETLANSNHAWNSVRIDGNWYLLDATWDAGAVNAETRSFVKKNSEYEFFLTNPKIFIYSHLPKDERWQLTNDNWNKSTFFNKVSVTESAFKLGLNIEKQSNATISADSLPYVIDFDSGVPLVGSLLANNSSLKGQWTLTRYDSNGRAKLLVSAPSNGSYTLQLFGDTQKRSMYFGFIKYKFVVSNSLNNFGVFPQTFPRYNNSKVVLDAPLNGELPSDKITTFRLKVSDAKRLVIYQNKRAVETMRQEDGYFIADLKLEKGELMIFGDFNLPNQLDGVLKYHVY